MQQRLSRALALSAYRERRPFNCVFSCCIDLSGWTTSRPSNESSNLNVVARRPIKVFVEKDGFLMWFVATEKWLCFQWCFPQDRSSPPYLCLCKGSFVLASQDARPRSSHLFPLLSGHFKQSNPCCCPRAVWPTPKDLFSFQALCDPSLQSRSEQGHGISEKHHSWHTSFAAEIVIGSPQGSYCMNESWSPVWICLRMVHN